MWYYGIPQSQHCNIDNDGHMMCANVWFDFFDVVFQCQNPWYMGRKCDIKEGYLNWAHSFHLFFYVREGVTLWWVTL